MSDASNSGDLELKITLDDGSIVQGFLKIDKAADKSAKNVAVGFDEALGGIKEGLDEVAPGITAIGDKLVKALTSPLGLITASVVAIGASLTKAFDLTLEGEQLFKIEKQFDSLASTFGVAGDALKDKFMDSLGGLVDDSDAIQSLNKAFVTLGDKVTQLPAVMDLARKATNLFGGEVTQNFEAMNQAIATGATRQLRGLGIVIDADKAYEKYAKSIGVTKDVLSEAGKQQAILNEVLDKGGARFKDVSNEVGGVTTAFTRFKVELQNKFEDVAKSFAQSGSYFEKFFESLSLIIKKVSGDPAQALDDLQIRINETKVRIFELQDALEKRQNSSGLSSFLQPFKDGEGITAKVINSLNQTKIQLADLTKQYDAVVKKSAEVKKNASGSVSTGVGTSSVDAELAKKETFRREKELTDFLLQQDQLRIQNKIQQNALLITEESNAAQKLSVMEENFDLQDQLREQQKSQAITAIREKYRVEHLTGSKYEKESLQAIENSFAQQELFGEQNRQTQLKLIREQANFDQLTGFSAVASGFTTLANGANKAADIFAQNSVAQFKQVGALAFTTLSQGVGRAFNNFGAALAKGGSAGKAFAEAIGDSLLQIASQFGDVFIQTGIGKLALSYGADATGYTLIAAGAALKILAGAIGASGGSADASSVDTGGGISSVPGSTTDLTPTTQLERQKPDTNIQVVIQGDVLDSEESGSRIVSLINQAFDKKGVVISQGAFA